jgi:hypothetical protein
LVRDQSGVVGSRNPRGVADDADEAAGARRINPLELHLHAGCGRGGGENRNVGREVDADRLVVEVDDGSGVVDFELQVREGESPTGA